MSIEPGGIRHPSREAGSLGEIAGGRSRAHDPADSQQAACREPRETWTRRVLARRFQAEPLVQNTLNRCTRPRTGRIERAGARVHADRARHADFVARLHKSPRHAPGRCPGPRSAPCRPGIAHVPRISSAVADDGQSLLEEFCVALGREDRLAPPTLAEHRCFENGLGNNGLEVGPLEPTVGDGDHRDGDAVTLSQRGQLGGSGDVGVERGGFRLHLLSRLPDRDSEPEQESVAGASGDRGCESTSVGARISGSFLCEVHRAREAPCADQVKPSVARSVCARKQLCVRAWSRKTEWAFSWPRTGSCTRPRLRVRAFTHSAVAARRR